jgi:hypothetical protein
MVLSSPLPSPAVPSSADRVSGTESSREMLRDVLTLSRHVLQQFGSFTAEAQDFSALMNRIALAGKMIARRLSQAGLIEGALGVTGSLNVQGEEQQQMDDYANRAFIRALEQTGLVCRLVSEEMKTPARLPENCSLSRLALMIDPLDGSSNIDANLSVGSIFSVLHPLEDRPEADNQDLLQPGRRQLAAGYILYGPSTQLVYSVGKGVHGFTLDPSLGEFILSRSDIRIPERGSVYSLNEGYFCHWSEGIQNYRSLCPPPRWLHLPLQRRSGGGFSPHSPAGRSLPLSRHPEKTGGQAAPDVRGQPPGFSGRAGGRGGHHWHRGHPRHRPPISPPTGAPYHRQPRERGRSAALPRGFSGALGSSQSFSLSQAGLW